MQTPDRTAWRSAASRRLGTRPPLLALIVLAAFIGATSFVSRRATAQGHDNRSAALALFEQGRELAAEGNHAAACDKFGAAAKLAHSAGTLLNLGDCYERTGRTASAWAAFRDAAGAAQRTGRDAEESEARRRQDALQPMLSHLRIDVPDALRIAGRCPPEFDPAYDRCGD
jgi:tetratricopeptide (TPR) repeat protein